MNILRYSYSYEFLNKLGIDVCLVFFLSFKSNLSRPKILVMREFCVNIVGLVG